MTHAGDLADASHANNGHGETVREVASLTDEPAEGKTTAMQLDYDLNVRGPKSSSTTGSTSPGSVPAMLNTGQPEDPLVPQRPSMRRGAKIVPHEPRVHEDAQASVGSLDHGDTNYRYDRTRRCTKSGGGRLVWSTNTGDSRDISRLIVLSRQALVQSRITPRPRTTSAKRLKHTSGIAISLGSEGSDDDSVDQNNTWWLSEAGEMAPLESDEVVLQHLHKVGAVDRCEYALVSGIGASGEATARQRHRKQRRAMVRAANAGSVSIRTAGSSGFLAAAIYDPSRPHAGHTRLYAPLPGYMTGYTQKGKSDYPGSNYSYDGDNRLDLMWRPKSTHGDSAHARDRARAASSTLPEAPESPQHRKLDRRGRGVGRADAKARWNDLEVRARTLLAIVRDESRNGKREQSPTLSGCLELLHSAETLPQPYTEICAQSDGAASLRTALVDVRQEIDAVRALSARARDCVCRGSTVLFSQAYNRLGVAYQGYKFHQRLSEAAEAHNNAEREDSLHFEALAPEVSGNVSLPHESEPIKDAEEVLKSLECARIFDESAYAGLAGTIKAGSAWNARVKAICGTAATRRKTSTPPSSTGQAPSPQELSQLAMKGSATPFADFELVRRAEEFSDWAICFDTDARVALAAQPRTANTYKVLFDLRRKLVRGYGRAVADAVALETRRDLDDVCLRAETWISDSNRVVAEPKRASLSTLRRLVSCGADLNIDEALQARLQELKRKGIEWTHAAANALAHEMTKENLDELHKQANSLAVPQIARHAVAKERSMRQWRVEAQYLVSACLTTSTGAASADVYESEDDEQNISTASATKKAKPPSMSKVRRHLDEIDFSEENNERFVREDAHANGESSNDCSTDDTEVDASLAAITAACAARDLEPRSDEELQLRTFLDEAEKWATRARIVARSDGAEASYALLTKLVHGGNRLRVDVTPHIRPLVMLQKRVETWLEATKQARKVLAMVETTPVHSGSARLNSHPDAPHNASSMDLDEVASSVAKAKRIAVAVDEIAQMRMFASRALTWRASHRELCGNLMPNDAAKGATSKAKPVALRSTTAASLAQLEGAFIALSKFLDVEAERNAISIRRDAVKVSLAQANELVDIIGQSAAASVAAFEANRQLPDDSPDRIGKLDTALKDTASSIARSQLEASLRLARWCAYVRELVSPLNSSADHFHVFLDANELAACSSDRDALCVDIVDEINHKQVFAIWNAIFEELRQRYGVLHSWQRRCADAAHSKRPSLDELRAVIRDAPSYIPAATTGTAAISGEGGEPGAVEIAAQEDDDFATVKKRLEWLEAAEDALRGPMSNKLSLRAMEALAKRAGPIRLSDSDDAKTLRAETRKARDWVNAVKRTGIEKGEASIAELRKLIASVRNIRVDLSDDVNVLVQASRAVCVCATPADGQMLDCPNCKTSFHEKCIFFCRVAKVNAEADPVVPHDDKQDLSAAASNTQMRHQTQKPSTGTGQQKRRRSSIGADSGNQVEAADINPQPQKRRAGVSNDRKRKGPATAPSKQLLDVDKCPRCQLRRCAAHEARSVADLIKLIRRDDSTPLGHALPGSAAAAALAAVAEAFGTETASEKLTEQTQSRAPAIIQNNITVLEEAAAEVAKSAHHNDHPRRRLVTALRRLAYSYRVGQLLQKAPRVSTIDALMSIPSDDSYGETEFRFSVTRHLVACSERARELVSQLRACTNAPTIRDQRTKAKKERRVDVSKVKAILEQARRIPVRLGKLRRQCDAIIEDGGRRYCICRGPSDGSFMLGCDSCDEWFHGHCVGVSEGDDVSSYVCVTCRIKHAQVETSGGEGRAEGEAARQQESDVQPSPGNASSPLEESDGKLIDGTALSGAAPLHQPQGQNAEHAHSGVPSTPVATSFRLDIDSLSDSSESDGSQELISEHPLPWPPAVMLKDEVPAWNHPTQKLRIDTSLDVKSMATPMPQLSGVLPSSIVGPTVPPALPNAGHPFLLDAHRQYMLPFTSPTPQGGQTIDTRLYDHDMARMPMLAPRHVTTLSPFQTRLCATPPRETNPGFVPSMSPILPPIQFSQQLQLHPQSPPLRQDLQQQHLIFHQRFLQHHQQRSAHTQQQHEHHIQQQQLHQHQLQQYIQQQQQLLHQQMQQPQLQQQQQQKQLPPQLQLHPYQLPHQPRVQSPIAPLHASAPQPASEVLNSQGTPQSIRQKAEAQSPLQVAQTTQRASSPQTLQTAVLATETIPHQLPHHSTAATAPRQPQSALLIGATPQMHKEQHLQPQIHEQISQQSRREDQRQRQQPHSTPEGDHGVDGMQKVSEAVLQHTSVSSHQQRLPVQPHANQAIEAEQISGARN